MPTIALLNGHAFAGGIMLAMHHDYRVMNPTRGFACVNELDFGVPLKPGMSAVFRLKLRDPAVYRAVVLEARRFAGPDALAAGLVDATGGLDAALALVTDRALATRARSGIYGAMKAEMYRESVGLLTEEGWALEEQREREARAREEARRAAGGKRVREWKGKAKL